MKSLFKLTPICVIAGLMLSGMDILLAAPISFLYSVFVAMIADRSYLSKNRTNFKYLMHTCPR